MKTPGFVLITKGRPEAGCAPLPAGRCADVRWVAPTSGYNDRDYLVACLVNPEQHVALLSNMMRPPSLTRIIGR